MEVEPRKVNSEIRNLGILLFDYGSGNRGEKNKGRLEGEDKMAYREKWQICQSQYNCELRYVLQHRDTPMCDHHLNETHSCQYQYCPLATEEKTCEC